MILLIAPAKTLQRLVGVSAPAKTQTRVVPGLLLRVMTKCPSWGVHQSNLEQGCEDPSSTETVIEHLIGQVL